MTLFGRREAGAIVLLLLVAGLFLVGRNIVLAADRTGPEQTTPTSPLPTPTQTPTPTITPTVTPTLAPNQLDCFAASRPDGTSMLLAWHIGQPTDVAEFVLWRAVVISPTQQTGFVENSALLPPMPSPVAQAFDSSVRYTTTNTGLETGGSYVYRLDVMGQSGQTLHSVTAYNPPPDSAPDSEICDPTRTSPTATPTPIFTPIFFPTSTPTPTRTATPTWTWTPTITPTGTWTPTPLPANTNTPPPTETLTPIPSDTPLPPTETPSPTFTITPTFTPDIRPPTPVQGGFDTQQFDQTPPPPDAPPDVPMPETTPFAMTQQFDEPSPDPPGVENPEPAEIQMALIAGDGGTEANQTSADVAAPVVAEQEESLPVYVATTDYRPRLLPGSRAGLFRYALFGVAGLAFFGALIFLAAGIGVRKE